MGEVEFAKEFFVCRGFNADDDAVRVLASFNRFSFNEEFGVACNREVGNSKEGKVFFEFCRCSYGDGAFGGEKCVLGLSAVVSFFKKFCELCCCGEEEFLLVGEREFVCGRGKAKEDDGGCVKERRKVKEVAGKSKCCAFRDEFCKAGLVEGGVNSFWVFACQISNPLFVDVVCGNGMPVCCEDCCVCCANESGADDDDVHMAQLPDFA